MGQENNILEFPVAEGGAPVELDQSNTTGEERSAPTLQRATPKPSIALALGGGAARGWAHIGVLRALDEAQIPVSMIAGTSIGALVGGCYLAGKLDELEEFARSITRWNLLRYMDFAVKASGLISGRRLADKMDSEIGHLEIGDLDRRFVAIATDIVTGSEIWLEHGSLSQAIRASYALPGVFQPVEHFGKQMVDGALVNPVPVSACRAYEEPVVMAVNLNSEVYGRSSVVRSGSLVSQQKVEPIEQLPQPESTSWLEVLSGQRSPGQSRLGIAGVMIEAFNIIQDRIARSRLAGDPPDFTIRPRLKGIGLSDFHRAAEAIDLGYEVAKARIESVEEAIADMN